MEKSRYKKKTAALGFVVLMLAASISGCRGVTKETEVPIAVTTAQETSSEATQAMEPETSSDERYSNPIDAYFLPRINGQIEAETNRRELEDTYRGVWKAEFENIMLWMQNKCIYQADKDNLSLFADSVQSMIDTSRTVILTDSLDDYKLQPDDPARSFWGTGTRSGLNQKEAEIYRDAGMLLVDDSYVFLDKDYSKEHYE